MARLAPKPSVVKRLFALSGNQCAYPDCEVHIVDGSGTVIGEICHIEAAEIGGERYNEDSDDEYRRSFDNLILMCSNHHTKTNNVDVYKAPKLRKFKADHENRNSKNQYDASDDIVNKAILNLMEQKNTNTGEGTQFNNQANTQNIGSQIGVQNIFSTENKSDEIIFDGARPIVKNLKEKIDKLKEKASPPEEDVIDYKNDLIVKRPSKIYEIPVKELKFRKENGRIKAEVESHEKIHGKLNEIEQDTQNLLKDFLSKNDPEKKEVLKQQIKHKGQLQPAIITCDGFLINGNRRKMILEELLEENHQDSRYENMRVIILPENVTLFDIKRIENRYQLQDDGKSEYHGLNRALTLRDNIKDNYTLLAQIKDDPQYSDKSVKELESIEKNFKKEYLLPLDCVDRYLKKFNREGLYNTISESTGDKEGRWQAFKDYSNFYYGTLEVPVARQKLGISENEIRKIEEAIFKIIRKRKLDSSEIEKVLGKVHSFVRPNNLKKYLGKQEAKKYILTIATDVPDDIDEKDKIDKYGIKASEREIDEKWGSSKQVKEGVLGNLMKAYRVVHNQIERMKPLELLEDSLKKLNHENMKIEELGIENYKSALDLCRSISSRADEIYKIIDNERGKLSKLGKKK